MNRQLAEELVGRLLAAAHTAPSVRLMPEPRFIVICDYSVRKAVNTIFEAANGRAKDAYTGEQAETYSNLKLEGLLKAPPNLCLLCDVGSGRRHGRQRMPETAIYSTVCAIQNLWLAARSEGAGVGWVSILGPPKLREILCIPQRLTLVAYLFLSYVEEFAAEPDLARFGWEKRVVLNKVVSYEHYSAAGAS